MRFCDMMILRTPAQVAEDARATEARILAPLDAMVIEAREVVEHYREAVPSAFSSRRDRRAGDRSVEQQCIDLYLNAITELPMMIYVRKTTPAAPRLPPFDLTHKRGPG